MSHLHLTNRESQVVGLRDAGKRFKEIAGIVGCSENRAHQLYHRALRRAVEPEFPDVVAMAPHCNPSRAARAYRTLRRNDLTLEQTKTMSNWELLQIEMLGLKTLHVIRAATGMAPPSRPISEPVFCPHCGEELP